MSCSGWKLTWVLMRALSSLVASDTVFESEWGRRRTNETAQSFCEADVNAGYFHLKHAYMHTHQSRSVDKAERRHAQKNTSGSKRISYKDIGENIKPCTSVLTSDFRPAMVMHSLRGKNLYVTLVTTSRYPFSYICLVVCYTAVGKAAFQIKTHFRQSFTNEIYTGGF